MPNPKRQHSRQRQRKRRTFYKATIPSMGTCPQCQKPILSHRVCPSCGYYKGKAILEIKTKTKKETKE